MPGLLRGVARTAVVAGTATTVSNRVSRRQAGRWAAEDQQQASQPQSYQQPTVEVPVDDGIAEKLLQLQKLGELKSQGVLTEAEFQAQKQQILG